jgi:hypothetical protein
MLRKHGAEITCPSRRPKWRHSLLQLPPQSQRWLATSLKGYIHITSKGAQ